MKREAELINIRSYRCLEEMWYFFNISLGTSYRKTGSFQLNDSSKPAHRKFIEVDGIRELEGKGGSRGLLRRPHLGDRSRPSFSE